MTAVLFDLFGVIARVQSPEAQGALEEVAGVDRERFWEAYWSLRHPYDRGDVAGPRYWQAVGARLGAPFGDGRIADLIAADLASWSRVDDESVDLLAQLADRGVVMGLLSNIPPEIADHYQATQGWFRHFQVVGLSCRIGSAKPEPAAYEWCRRELNLPTSEILFVDDRAGNVEAARAIGMRGHEFTTVDALTVILRDHDIM